MNFNRRVLRCVLLVVMCGACAQFVGCGDDAASQTATRSTSPPGASDPLELRRRGADAIKRRDLSAAREVKVLMDSYARAGEWNSADAASYSHALAGRIALIEGNVELAKQELLASVESPGGAAMRSFGPDLHLAAELLERGESEVVLAFLKLCRKFWDDAAGRIPKWESEIRAGRIPRMVRPD